MKNLRYTVALGDGTLEVDCTRLPSGTSVYEVEIENSDEGVRSHLASMILKLAPSATPSKLSKFARFSDDLRRSRWPQPLNDIWGLARTWVDQAGTIRELEVARHRILGSKMNLEKVLVGSEIPNDSPEIRAFRVLFEEEFLRRLKELSV